MPRKNRWRGGAASILFKIELALIFVLLIVAVWVWWPHSPLIAFSASEKVEILGCPKDSYEYKIIKRYLESVTPEMRRSLEAIEVSDDDRYYKSPLNAAVHLHPQRKIYIKSVTLRYQPSVLWHEISHAHISYLNLTWTSFMNKWNDLAPPLITPYAASTYNIPEENVCEWVYELYKASEGRYSEFDGIKSLSFTDPDFNKKIYAKTIDLLFEYKFLSAERYASFRANFSVFWEGK